MKNRKMTIIIIILASVTLLLGYMNMRDMEGVSAKDGRISFVSGSGAAELDFDEITSLPHYEFTAVEDTSSAGPSSRKFKGVLLREVLNRASITDDMIKASKKVVIKGLDGYAVALAADEILSGSSVYLAFEKDGKPLGSMKKGGSGPFQMISRTDSFSQRWCKYVTEVSIE